MRHLWNSRLILIHVLVMLGIKGLLLIPNAHLTALIDNTISFSAHDVIVETNGARSAFGLEPLKENTVLDTVAAQKLQDMISHQYFAHVSPQGIDPWHWFQANNYVYTYAGENLAEGFTDAKSTVMAWENSPAHRRNLMNPNYEEIGIAVAPARFQDVDGIIVVQELGAPGITEVAVDSLPVVTTTPVPSHVPIHMSAPSVPVSSPVAMAYEAPTVLGSGTVAPVMHIQSEAPAGIRTLASILNNVFMWYALLAAALSLSYLIVRYRTREVLLKTALHLAIFFIAVFLPLAWNPIMRMIG